MDLAYGLLPKGMENHGGSTQDAKNASPWDLGETQTLKTNQFETKRRTESKGLNFSDILDISN